MIIESIEVHNFLSHEESVVDFSGSPLTLVCGDNGSGKSSLFDAAEYILYGKHRGGKQDAKLLIKDGANRARVSMVIRLGSIRYRVTRQIDAKTGNQPAIVERWDGDHGEWEPVNVGDHVQDAWDWLERSLPDYDLFRSAIYLRQGETAHFLSGQASKRLERFAALVDLSQYTELGERAKKRRDDARQRQRDAEVQLVALGDLSAEALASLTARIQETNKEHRLAQAHTAYMEEITTGAREWARLLREQAMHIEQRDRARDLLAEEAQIRGAADQVQQWERTKPLFDRYWDVRHRGESYQTEAKTTAATAEEHGQAYEKLSNDLVRLNSRQQDLNEIDLPEAQARVDAQNIAAEDLALEVQIAEALASYQEASRQTAGFGDLDTVATHWKLRERALPLLRQLVTAYYEEKQGQRELVDVKEALDTSKTDVASTAQNAERADHEATDTRRAHEVALQNVNALNEVHARISGSMQSHRRLQGDEEECPICARVLDKDAHIHVRVVLANERQQAAQLADELNAARQDEGKVRAALEEAERQLLQDKAKHEDAQRAYVRAQERMDHAKKAGELASLHRDTLHSNVAEIYPPYAQDAATLSSEDVQREAEYVRGELAELASRIVERDAAHEVLLLAQAEANTLCAARRAGAHALAETRTIDYLINLTNAAHEALVEQNRVLEDLKKELRDIQLRLQTVMGELATHAAKRDAAQLAAQRSSEEADSAAAEARRIATQVGSEWHALFEDEEEVARQNDAVEQVRALAGRLSDLEQAYGRLTHLVNALEIIQVELDKIPSEYRLAVEEAGKALAEARASESEANLRSAQAVKDQSIFLSRRTAAEQCQATIDAESIRAQIHNELFDLLKEGGQIQVEVAEQEQRRIRDEVNSVLGLLDDPLRVTLGEARHTRGMDLQDVRIVDTSDPYGKSRYFEFLSGGEQFRVAMALALALHRRVGKGGAGTLIVDEGFGALDGNRRDALAQQMTNISQGVLHLQLAHNIVICSHSVEVQRHFPYRWLITKRDGTATASLTDLTHNEDVDVVLVGDL